MKYLINFFAANSEDDVLSAISSSVIKYPAYCFIRSADDTSTGRLAFVDQDNLLKYVVDDEFLRGIDRIETTESTEDKGINTITLYFTDGTSKSFEILNGSKGEKGDTGDQGIQGVKGDTGLGIAKAEINDSGELVITYTDNTSVNLGVIKGDPGLGIPTVTTADNGKILKVENGVWAAAELPIYDGGTE